MKFSRNSWKSKKSKAIRFETQALFKIRQCIVYNTLHINSLYLKCKGVRPPAPPAPRSGLDLEAFLLFAHFQHITVIFNQKSAHENFKRQRGNLTHITNLTHVGFWSFVILEYLKKPLHVRELLMPKKWSQKRQNLIIRLALSTHCDGVSFS